MRKNLPEKITWVFPGKCSQVNFSGKLTQTPYSGRKKHPINVGLSQVNIPGNKYLPGRFT